MPVPAGVRPFVHADGRKQAWRLSKEAFRGIFVALGVAGAFKLQIDGVERFKLSQYYSKPHPTTFEDK